MGRRHSIRLLPIFIPKSFDSLNSVISSYIWRGKHPQLNKALHQKSWTNGGLALPNFRYYYWAANTCLYLGSISKTKIIALPGCPWSWTWLQIHLFWLWLDFHPPYPQTRATDNPVVWLTVRVWAQMRRHLGLKKFNILKYVSPTVINHGRPEDIFKLFRMLYWGTRLLNTHMNGCSIPAVSRHIHNTTTQTVQSLFISPTAALQTTPRHIPPLPDRPASHLAEPTVPPAQTVGAPGPWWGTGIWPLWRSPTYPAAPVTMWIQGTPCVPSGSPGTGPGGQAATAQ